MEHLKADYWDSRYREETATWDIGYASTPLKEYFDQLTDKNIKILIPGCGHGYEAEYLFRNNFKNVFIIDFSDLPLKKFHKRIPEFPAFNIINEDFFKHRGSYDLIIEQTFFCAINPNLRRNYIEKTYELLNPKGKIAGLLFDFEFEKSGPPFGGNVKEYTDLFSRNFELKYLEKAYNSIEPRSGKEVFILCSKKDKGID